ncbi:MAG TPA: orotidine-5'-phosphate decarboxylase [Longimicrobiaceae bacterium]|nr:orotidine-5'-phosphate decarboxylase [Longimicrobiaceae bacterium]
MHPDSTAVDRLVARIRALDSCCVVGLDPNLERIRAVLGAECPEVSPRDPAACAEVVLDFNRRVIGAVHDLAAAVKPQSAYYEVYGEHGIRALRETIASARERGLPVILDAKRNDIGETARAYARAYLGSEEGPAALDADFLTVSPYLGMDSLLPFVDACRAHGKGIFVLAKTSNPGSADLQDLVCGGVPVYERVAALLRPHADALVGRSGYSAVGIVVGGTFPAAAAALRQALPRSLFLVPGYGAQGAGAGQLRPFFDAEGLGALVSASRSVLYPDAARVAELGPAGAIRAEARKMVESLRAVAAPA